MAITAQQRANRLNRAKRGTSATKENDGPGPIDTGPERASRSKTDALRDLQATRTALSDLSVNYSRLQTRCNTFQRSANRYKQQLGQLRTSSSLQTGCRCNGAPMVTLSEYEALSHVLDYYKRQLSASRRDVKLYRDRLHYARRTEGKAAAKAAAEAKLIVVKQKGKVPHPVRALIRNWSIICNVPSKKVFPCIRMFCDTFGLTLRGTFSHGLVGLTIFEAGLLARLQIASAVQDAQGATMSNDGTSHRNQHFAAHHITVKLANGLVRIFNAGLLRVPTKSADQQEADWKRLLQDIWDFFNSSPLGSAEQLSATVFLRILCATSGDHASDQIKLNRLVFLWKQATDRLARGQEVIDALPDVQYHGLVAEIVMERAEALGDVTWDSLTAEERQAHVQAGLEEVAVRLGWEAFNQLDPHAQASVDFFFHFGCEMHKELNTVVYGNKYMQAAWALVRIPGPIILYNKENAASAATGSPADAARAKRESQCGGVKTVSLAGGILRNKDTKRGQQRLFNTWSTIKLRITIEFPDVGRSRFQTTCLGAGFLILRLELVIEFLELVRDAKDSPGFTNMERNVYLALHDPPTLTELAVLALYPHLVTIPYICSVRKSGVNALDLAPAHEKVKAHCRALAANPGLFLDVPLEESHVAATLDGLPYYNIDTVRAVLERYNSGQLPEFRHIFSHFMTGTADGWDHFATEFDEGGTLADAAPEDLARCHVDPTNDRNEHGLAGMRRLFHAQPHAVTETISARLMYRDNDTAAFAETLSAETLDTVLSAGRALAARSSNNPEGDAEAQRLEDLAAANRAKALLAQQQRDATNARLDAFTSERIVNSNLIPAKITVKQLDPELEWHRHRGLPEGHPDKIPKVKKALPNRKAKIDALVRAIDSLNAWLAAGNSLAVPTEARVQSDSDMGQDGDCMDIDEDEDD